MSDGKVTYEVRSDDSKLDKDLNKSMEKVKDFGKKAGNVAGGTAKAIGTSFLAVGTAAVGIGAVAINSANDLDKAMNSFQASTGMGQESLEGYESTLKDIYKNNYGESFEDISQKMGLVTQQLGQMDNKELQKVVESGYLIQDVYGIDMQESLNGAESLMKQFGTTAEESYNLIAQGAEWGLNKNGDLADQLAEYSTYYSDIGFSAEEMMNTIIAGAAEGSYNVDYLNDAIKEFGIRTKDGSSASKKAFEDLGLNADEMTKKFANGGKDARKAFDQVNDALKNVDDKVLQNQIGVALYGTKFEDLGADAVLSMSDVETAIDGTRNKLDEMGQVKYDNLGSMMEGLGRTVEVLLIPLGEMLIPMLKDIIEAILPVIEQKLPSIIELVGSLFSSILPVIEQALPVLISLFEKLMPPLLEIIEKLMPPLLKIIDALVPVILSLSEALIPIIDLFIALLEPILDVISEGVLPLIDALVPLIETLADMLIPVVKFLAPLFKEILNNIFDNVSTVVKNITKIFNGFLKFITGVFTGNWKQAWSGLKDIVTGMVGGIVGVVKMMINNIISVVNGFIGGLNTIKIPEWVPELGGKGINIPKIPRLKVGMDYVPKDDFPALLHEGESVLTKKDASIWRTMQGMGGISTNGINGIGSNMANSITRREIQKAFSDALNEYKPNDNVIYIGNEEIARASNKGNLILETMYGK